MNKELRSNIITAILAAVLTASGFIGKEYYGEYSRKEQFSEKLYKELYDDSAKAINSLNQSYSNLILKFSDGYALSKYEVDAEYKQLQKALDEYNIYIKKLKRYGNSEQVEVATTISEWIRMLYAEFFLHHENAEMLERRVQELLLIEDPSSGGFKFVNEALESELENFMQLENRVFYETSMYRKPVISAMEQYLNYQFRMALGIEPTKDMIETINSINKLIKRDPQNQYVKSDLPFLFAKQRVYLAPTLEFPKDGFSENKNSLLKQSAKLRLISQVIENNQELQSILKARKEEEEKAAGNESNAG